MTKTVTISATRTDGTPYAHHDVIVTLVAGSAGGVVGSNVVVESSTVRLDASGAGSIVLATNDVEVTSPSESFYRFTVEGSSPTITRSIRLTTGLASTVSWTLAGIQVGDPSVPQRDVSSTYVTVPAGTLPGVEADYPPVTQSLTNVLASIDDAIAAGGGGGGVDLSDTTPSALGTAAAGTGIEASRDDHVHAMPSAADVGADPAGTAAALVDDLSGVTDAATARSNLGLGGAAVLAVGTTAGTVAAGDDARLSDARTPTAHNHAASEVTSGTLDIARIPTGTTSTTVPLGNDSRFGPVPGQGLYVAGSLYGTPCATGGTRTVANGSLYFFPIIIDGTTATADALCINVLTGVASSTVHLYLVSSSATTGRPTAASTVLAKASNVSTASSSTRVVAAFDSSATASLTRGTYWGAIHSIAGTPTLRAAASAFQFGPPLVQQTPDTANGITLISATGGGTSTTALTSLAGLSFNADLNQAPIVFWRAA